MDIQLANQTITTNATDCHLTKGGYIAAAPLLTLNLYPPRP